MIHEKAAFLIFFVSLAHLVFPGGDGEGRQSCFAAQPQKIEGVDGITEGNLYLDGRVYIAGQPTESALAELGRRGVTAVVNVRTPAEIEDREKVPFEEESAVRDLGMSYVSIPLGDDDHPYEPAAIERLAEVLSSHDGPVLIHCTYGWRAAYLWLAHLVQNEGLPLEQAMARGEAMMLRPHPVGRLLGRPTKLVFAEQDLAPRNTSEQE